MTAFKKNLEIRTLAETKTRHLKSKDYYGEIHCIWAYVASDIRFIRDTNGVEIISSPLATIERGCGDCFNKAILLAALLESIGHKTLFKAVGFAPKTLSHVYVQTPFRNKWISADPSMPNEHLGWQPSNIKNMYLLHNE